MRKRTRQNWRFCRCITRSRRVLIHSPRPCDTPTEKKIKKDWFFFALFNKRAKKNQSFFNLFCIFFASVNCCIDAIHYAGDSSSFFFSGHKICLCRPSNIKYCESSSIFLFYRSCVWLPFKKDAEYLTKESAQAVVPFSKVSFRKNFLFFWGTLFFFSICLTISTFYIPRKSGFEKFSCSSEVLFFFSLHLLDDFYFLYYQEVWFRKVFYLLRYTFFFF